MAISQMNYITGLNVPVVVGTPFVMKSRQDTLSYASSSQLSGINAVLNILRKSEKPVAIHVVGCCRDIAIAGKKEPKLFEKKCKAIYLNAGNSSADLWKGSRPGEYNVSLDTISYAAIFDLPCKIYWMPCVGYINKNGKRILNEYRTMYTINQGEMLSHLSDMMQNYIAYMSSRSQKSDWLTFLTAAKQEEIINQPKTQKDKNMWCTAGFFYTAGKTVLADGKVVSIEQAKGKGIFSFEPVKITCGDNGITKWSLDKSSKDRFIFHIRDVENYQPAMIKALKDLLITMP
jgi:inosine-uridine nucleoside N-ribohydrolase